MSEKIEDFPFYGWDIFESEHFFLGQDWETPIPGFFVLGVRKDELRSISEMSGEEYADYCEMMLKARRLMKGLGIETVCIYQEETTSHFHTWIMPRYDWMERFGKSVDSVWIIMEYARENMMTEENIKEVREVFEKAVEWVRLGIRD